MTGRHARVVLDVGSTVLVLVAAVALLWTLYQDRGRNADVAAAATQNLRDITIDSAGATKQIGRGPIAIVEFADFQCPFCARHARDTFPHIRTKLIDTDRVTYVAFALPLQSHPLARKAGEAAECAAREGKYWEMHRTLFQEPLRLDAPDLLRAAESIGLERARFEDCLGNGAADAVASDIQRALRLTVSATPTFFVGQLREDGKINVLKRLNGALPFEAFEAAVDHVSKL